MNPGEMRWFGVLSFFWVSLSSTLYCYGIVGHPGLIPSHIWRFYNWVHDSAASEVTGRADMVMPALSVPGLLILVLLPILVVWSTRIVWLRLKRSDHDQGGA